MMGRGPQWTDADWQKAQRLAKQGWHAGRIADEMHRSEEAIRARFNYMGVRGLQRAPTQGSAGAQPAGAPKASEQALADRDARFAASLLRTQTQEFFGDPPPGFSHLDKVRNRSL